MNERWWWFMYIACSNRIDTRGPKDKGSLTDIRGDTGQQPRTRGGCGEGPSLGHLGWVASLLCLDWWCHGASRQSLSVVVSETAGSKTDQPCLLVAGSTDEAAKTLSRVCGHV
jgi:hypothetical protein